MTRRSRVTKRMPNDPPTIISATDFQYASAKPNDFQAPEMMKAGIVKTAPAATDSPIEPTVRAIFSSSSVPFIRRKMAMPMTAAG